MVKFHPKHLLLGDINEDLGGPRRPLRFLLPEAKVGVAGRLLAILFTVLSSIYDCITIIPYFIWQNVKPDQKIRVHHTVKARMVSDDPCQKTWRSEPEQYVLRNELESIGVTTMEKAFSYATTKFGNKECLGTRQLLSEEEDPQPDGKVLFKCVLGSYQWKTYTEVDSMARDFVAGLVTLGVKPGDKIGIFAETRAEWLIAASGAFKHNLTIVTLYSTLGDDAVIYGLRETECSIVLTSYELLPKFRAILPETPAVNCVVFMEHPLNKPVMNSSFQPPVQIHGFRDVIQMGRTLTDFVLQPPVPEDIAIIMYTSGTTGIPKGVLLAHKNIVAALLAMGARVGDFYADDTYMAYLPLAHVLELLSEVICLVQGTPVGYSSPLTITSKSPKIKPGTDGDAVVLKPSIMVSVPFALDRIYKGIQEQVGDGGTFKKTLFYFFYDYKLKWYYRGFETPLVDAMIMKKVRMIMGGRVRILVSGGAPLLGEIHEFIRNCLCMPGFHQGYGLTESTAAAAITIFGDMSTSRIGTPLACCDIRLENWDEGGYTVKDFPKPRGELVIGGENVAMGYFKREEQTAQDFFVEGGRRWFRTGDIAEVDTDGSFRIIDRKKDLVKLQMGEYLSLGKIETALKTSPSIDNICIIGDSLKTKCVAIVVPIQKQLESLVARLGLSHLSYKTACSDPLVVYAFLTELQAFCTASKLSRFEIPAALTLTPDLWTPETDLVTGAFKLKRKCIQEKFQKDIVRMYEQLQTY